MLCEQHESEELWLKERVFELIERNRLLGEECTSLGKQNSDLKSQVAILVTNHQDTKNENVMLLEQLSTATDENNRLSFQISDHKHKIDCQSTEIDSLNNQTQDLHKNLKTTQAINLAWQKNMLF